MYIIIEHFSAYYIKIQYKFQYREKIYFCSNENIEKLNKIIGERRRKIEELRQKFESITAIKKFENDILTPAKEGNYFRRSGPVKYHLEKKLMFKRNKVNEIEDDFTNKENPKNIQLLNQD